MPYFMLFNIKYLDIAIFWKPSIVFFVKTLACLKYLRTFAPLLTKSTSEKKFWRDGRVVDCGGLENRCTARYPGFESLSLRKEIVILVKSRFYENFFCSFSKMKNRKVGTDLFFRREMVNFKNA